ncbi:MAG TPA: class I SAM-dependent methyltransferase [Solirubrobacteraceae bacterium]|nr:class I SAM-dependent methyltransferase [Solirubrobacteraceae bacterium]
MPNDPHEQWERFGARDPYFAVLTEPRYHREQLDDGARERFFASGRQVVDGLLGEIEAHTGASPQQRRALDFGCGVGRLSLALAERCSHVYGVDVSPSMLAEAERNAAEKGSSNVEWVLTGQLGELAGSYDLVLSAIVFQHIPVREGERLFATLVRGLRPGGVAAIQLTLKTHHTPLALLRWLRKSLPLAPNLANLMMGKSWSHPYMELNSYSLERLARLLAQEGVSEWHARFMPARKRRNFDKVTLFFRKP